MNDCLLKVDRNYYYILKKQIIINILFLTICVTLCLRFLFKLILYCICNTFITY